MSVTVTQLRIIGNHLVDVHGAYDHQLLLDSSSHIHMIDKLISIDPLLTTYREKFTEYSETKKEIDHLSQLSQSRERDLDLLSHQVKELEQVKLDQEHFDHIKQKQNKIDNAQRILSTSQTLLQYLDSDTNAISNQIRQSFTVMRQLNVLDESTEPLHELLTQSQENNNQLVNELTEYSKQSII